MIDAAMLEQMRAKVDAMPDGSGVDLTPLTTSAELLAFCATTSRAEGWDECDMCELVVRLSPMSPDTVRDAVRVLEPLGIATSAPGCGRPRAGESMSLHRCDNQVCRHSADTPRQISEQTKPSNNLGR